MGERSGGQSPLKRDVGDVIHLPYEIMITVKDYIPRCEEAIAAHDSAELSIYEAASKMSIDVFDGEKFEERVHPMLFKIADLAFEVAEQYRSKEEDQENWALLLATVSKYASGDWEPTGWMLSAMYGEYAENKLVHSYSVFVQRRRGEILVTSASHELQEELQQVAAKIHSNQTDEWLLHNLAHVLPEKIGNLTFVNVDVNEYLAPPF